jgi:hypothetical protein
MCNGAFIENIMYIRSNVFEDFICNYKDDIIIKDRFIKTGEAKEIGRQFLYKEIQKVPLIKRILKAESDKSSSESIQAACDRILKLVVDHKEYEDLAVAGVRKRLKIVKLMLWRMEINRFIIENFMFFRM